MTPKETYNYFLQKIESRMSECIPEKEPLGLYQPFKYIMTGGGKRLRPVLTVLAAGAVGDNPEKAIDSGIAIEILHNFTLAHDDIMDEASTRRGKDTIHKKWDVPTAILVGDMMVGFAYKLLPTCKDHIRADEIYAAFSDGLVGVCEGQAYDMQFNQRPDVTIDEYFNMIYLKTAKIIETAAVIGAHIGTGTDEEVGLLRQYSISLGIAFQLQDDLLDITASEAEFGKSIGQDIVEGKKTFLILKTLQRLRENPGIHKEYEELMSFFYKNNGLGREYIPRVQDMFVNLGIYDKIEDEINSRISSSLESISKLRNNIFTETLYYLAENLLNRKF